METTKPASAQSGGRHTPGAPARVDEEAAGEGGGAGSGPGSGVRPESAGSGQSAAGGPAASTGPEAAQHPAPTHPPSPSPEPDPSKDEQGDSFDRAPQLPPPPPGSATRKQLTTLPEEEPEEGLQGKREATAAGEETPGDDTAAPRRSPPPRSPQPAPRTPRHNRKPGVGWDIDLADSTNNSDSRPTTGNLLNTPNGTADPATDEDGTSPTERPGTTERGGPEPEPATSSPAMGVKEDAAEVEMVVPKETTPPPPHDNGYHPQEVDSGMGSPGEESASDVIVSSPRPHLGHDVTVHSPRPVGVVPHVSGGGGGRGAHHANTKSKAFSGKSTLSTRASTLSSAGGQSEADDEIDSINVAVRVRPLSTQESKRNDKQAVEFPGHGGISVDTGAQQKSFTFNVTFEPQASQEDVFEYCGVKKLVEMALDGYSCTAFAFGQTGSGKTHTITGPPELFTGEREAFVEGSKPEPELYGLIPRSFHYLFRMMNKSFGTTGVGYRLFASYMEIYNEQVIDLLNPNQRRPLAVRWSKHKGFYVENLFVLECETTDDIMAVLEEGLRNRATGSNSVNEHSSRSHSMLTLHIDSDVQDPEDENVFITKHGKLTFVDLAGSEKVKNEIQNTAGHLAESNNINKSLLVLGNCISALGDVKRRQGHIPYRDSKLTKLLADSLGGNGVTLMIACVSPSLSNSTESLNTLRYANRAKKIKTKPAVKMDPREKLIMSLKREIKILRQENHYLRKQLDFPDRGNKDEESKETKETKDSDNDKNSDNPESKEQSKGSAEQEGQSSKSADGEDRLEMPLERRPTALEFPVKPKGQLQKENDERFLQLLQEQQDSDKGGAITDHGLYEMLQEYMIENETLRTENSDLHQLRDTSRREQQTLARENEKLLRKLETMERERMMMHTPLSIYSVGSSSRQTSASELNFERTPHNTPPAWGHNPVPMEYYGRDSTQGSWTQGQGGRQPMEHGIPTPAWGTPVGTPVGTPRGTPRGTPYGSPLPHENGPHPSYSGPSRRNPPAHLQHPMRPPHRLSEPVVKQNNTSSYEAVPPGAPVPQGAPIPPGAPYAGAPYPGAPHHGAPYPGAPYPEPARTYVVTPRGPGEDPGDFSRYITGYVDSAQRNAGYMTRYYQQQDFKRDNPQGPPPARTQGWTGPDYQSSGGPPQYSPHSQGPPPINYSNNYGPGAPPAPQNYAQGPSPQNYAQGQPAQSYAQGPASQGPPPEGHRGYQPAPVQRNPNGYNQDHPVPTPRKSKGASPASQGSRGSYSKTTTQKKPVQKAPPPPPPPEPKESIEEMNERLKRELMDLEGAIKQETHYKPAVKANGYGGRR